MRNSSALFSLTVALAGLVTVVVSGCSRDAKKASILTKADQYYKAGEYDKAEIEYKNVLQLGGRDPQAIGRLGLIYFEQGRLVRSSEALNLAIGLQPDNLDVKLKLGYIDLAMGKRVEARNSAVSVLERRPADPEAPLLLAESIEYTQPKDAADARAFLEKLSTSQSASVLTALAMINLRERKIPEAENLLDRAIQVDPKLATTHAIRAGLYVARKDMAAAENALETAVKLAPPRSVIRLQYAQFNLQTGKPDVAKRLLDEMIRVTPDFLPSYVLRADIAASEKKFEESIALLDKVLTREPIHLEASMLAARVRMANNETDKAIAILEKAAPVFAPARQLHELLGSAYLAKGDLDKANASLSQAVKLEPRSPAAVLGLANVSIRQRNFAQAVTSLTAFLQNNPTNRDAQLLLADAYRNQGNLDEALRVYRQLADANPTNAQLQQFIGTLLLQQAKTKEARAAFIKASELSPASLAPIEQLVNIDLAEKQYASALSRITSRLAQNPNEAAAHFILANIHLAQGSGEKAEIALKKAIELEPQLAAAHSLLAQYYVSSNQPEKALPALQAAAAISPSNIGILFYLAALHEQKKDFAAAREVYEKLLAVNVTSKQERETAAAAMNNLASLYSEQFGDIDRAQSWAQKANELLPNRAEPSDTLGWIYYKKRQYPRALTLLEDAVAKLPNNAEVQYHFGMAQYMMGNEEAARVALARALQLNTSFPGAGEARESLAILSADRVDEGVRAQLNRAIERRADDPIVLSRFAKLYETEGNIEKALGAYETVLKSNPGNVNAALNAIRLHRSRVQTAKALELAKVTRRFAPNDGRIAHVLGRLAFENREYLFSVGVLRDAARIQNGDAEVSYDLGEAFYSVGQVAAAETAFREALAAKSSFSRAENARQYVELIQAAQDPSISSAVGEKIAAALRSDPSNVPALMAQAALNEQKNDLKAAKDAYEKALARYSEFTPAKRNLALLYSLHPEDDKKALELATKARETYPNDDAVAKALGIISSRNGNYTRAASLLEESARTRTTDAEVQYHLGMAQRQLKKQNESTRALQKALELGLSGKLEADARRVLTAKQ